MTSMLSKLSPSSMHHCMEVEEPAEAQNAAGEPVRTWSKVASVWARVEPLSGQELVNAKQVDASVTHRVTMPYRAGVTPKMRLVFRARNLNIVSVINLEEANRWLVMLCREAV